jgi:hypothetical protein
VRLERRHRRRARSQAQREQRDRGWRDWPGFDIDEAPLIGEALRRIIVASPRLSDEARAAFQHERVEVLLCDAARATGRFRLVVICCHPIDPEGTLLAFGDIGDEYDLEWFCDEYEGAEPGALSPGLVIDRDAPPLPYCGQASVPRMLAEGRVG